MKTPPGLNKVDRDAPFWQELQDENAPTINVNGKDIKHCLWNLLVTQARRSPVHGGHQATPWVANRTREEVLRYQGWQGEDPRSDRTPCKMN